MLADPGTGAPNALLQPVFVRIVSSKLNGEFKVLQILNDRIAKHARTNNVKLQTFRPRVLNQLVDFLLGFKETQDF